VSRGQSPNSRFEAGGQFSDIKLLDTSRNASLNAGFGSRFDWHLTPRVALDTPSDFFPRSYASVPPQSEPATRATASFSATTTAGSQPSFLFTPNIGGATFFALDLGVRAEFYSSDRWILREEMEASPYFVGDAPRNYAAAPKPEGIRVVSSPETVTNTWQVSAGMSYRPGEVEPTGPVERVRQERFELGAQFTALNLAWIDGVDHSSTEPGVGLLASYNIWQFVYLDAAVSFFPKDEPSSGPNDGGRILQGFFGTKEGFQVQRFGFFAKVRPGFMSYARTLTSVTLTSPMPFRYARATDFALDVGGVVEYYWGRHALLRFDVGDSLMYNSPRRFNLNGTVSYPPVPAQRNSLQLAMGLAIRF
jgi:hypothetical protein